MLQLFPKGSDINNYIEHNLIKCELKWFTNIFIFCKEWGHPLIMHCPLDVQFLHHNCMKFQSNKNYIYNHCCIGQTLFSHVFHVSISTVNFIPIDLKFGSVSMHGVRVKLTVWNRYAPLYEDLDYNIWLNHTGVPTKWWLL